ncbi:hypothetical protein Tco_1546031 [Tanacetum coccineum]
MSFSKRPGNDVVCYTKPLDSLKNGTINGLFRSFVLPSPPKVRIGEMQRGLFDEVGSEIKLNKPRRLKKRKTTVFYADGSSHPPKKLREDHGTLSGASRSEPYSDFAVLWTSSCCLPTARSVRKEDHTDSLALSVSLMTMTTTVTSTVDPTTTVKGKLVESSVFGDGSSSGADHTVGGFSGLTGKMADLEEVRKTYSSPCEGRFRLWRIRNIVLENEKVHKLKASSAVLQDKVTAYDNFMGQLEKFQDDRIREMNEKFNKLDTDLVELALHLEERFYPHLLTTISGRSMAFITLMAFVLVIAHALNSDRRIKENIANDRSALRDVFVPLAEPLSIAALEGTACTSGTAPLATTTRFIVTSSSSTPFRLYQQMIMKLCTTGYAQVGNDAGFGKQAAGCFSGVNLIRGVVPLWDLIVSCGSSAGFLPRLLAVTLSAACSLCMPISAGMTASVPYCVIEKGWLSVA